MSTDFLFCNTSWVVVVHGASINRVCTSQVQCTCFSTFFFTNTPFSKSIHWAAHCSCTKQLLITLLSFTSILHCVSKKRQ